MLREAKRDIFYTLPEEFVLDRFHTWPTGTLTKHPISVETAKGKKTVEIGLDEIADARGFSVSTKARRWEICYYYRVTYLGLWVAASSTGTPSDVGYQQVEIGDITLDSTRPPGNLPTTDPTGGQQKNKGTAVAGTFLGAYAYEYVYNNRDAETPPAEILVFHGAIWNSKQMYGHAGAKPQSERYMKFDEATLAGAAAGTTIPEWKVGLYLDLKDLFSGKDPNIK